MRTRKTEYLTFNREKSTELLYCSLCIFLIILLSSCGEGYYTSSETGSIAFSVEWHGAPTNQALNASIKAASLDCEAAGVSTVEAGVYDENNSYLAGGGPWDCEAHSGTITDVPAGPNRKVAILGKNSAGSVLYRGEVTGITVTASQTNNAGEIVANTFCPTPTAPEDGSTVQNGAFSFEWNPIAGGSEFQIQVSTDSLFETIAIDTTTVSTTYAPSELSFGETYYWRVKAKDSYGNESGWSEVWRFTVSTEPGIAPSAPTNVTAAAGDGQVSISWDSVSGAKSYNIYWATSSGVSKADYEGEIGDITETLHTHTGLTNGTTYYYVVTAENSYGESDQSDEVNATPEAGENNPPQLSNGYVSPESGTTVDTFTFYAYYYDMDGDNPAMKYVYIDGTGYSMEFYSGSFSNGTYRYEASLGEGDHTFYFEFTGVNGGTSRLPTTGTYSGPKAEAAAVTVTGKILNNGQPVVNVLMEIYDRTDSDNWTLIDDSYTDNEGLFSLSFIHDSEVTEYAVEKGPYYSNANDTFIGWGYFITSFESDQLVLPDFDIYYNELFSPPDGATYRADEISDSNPIIFEWTNGGRSDIESYTFHMWKDNVNLMDESTDSTTISFNGIMNDGTKITAGTYEWKWTCHFEETWVASTADKTLIIQ